jgi:hypothetical protein
VGIARTQRELIKQAMELSWLDHGEAMYGAAYDHARELVLHGTAEHGYYAFVKEVEWPDRSRGIDAIVNHLPLPDGRTQLTITGSYYGVLICTDSVNAEPLGAADERIGVMKY